MEKEFLDFISVSDVQTKGRRKRRVGYKPFAGIVVLMAFGIFALAIPNPVCRIMGIFVLLIGLAVIVLVKNRHVIDFYTEGVLIYKHDDDSLGAFMDYRSIEGWSAKKNKGNGQTLLLLFEDQRFFMTDTFALLPVSNTFFKYMPGKELNS